MYGIVVDGEVKYVSCIEDFKDLLGAEAYNTMVKLWEESERSARCELEQTEAQLDDAYDVIDYYRGESRDYQEKWLKVSAENKLLREELFMLKEKLGG